MTSVALTQKQIRSPEGAELLAMLMDMTSDGTISDEEVQRLLQWLTSHRTAGMRAVDYLLEVVEHITRDGPTSLAGRWEVLIAIERCVPAAQRALVKMRRRTTPEPVTPRQLEFLRMLGAEAHDNLTKEEAGNLIDTYKDRQRDARQHERDAAKQYRSSGRGRKASAGESGCGCLILILLIGWASSYCSPQQTPPAKPATPTVIPR